jgi:hypothetical protein
MNSDQVTTSILVSKLKLPVESSFIQRILLKNFELEN